MEVSCQLRAPAALLPGKEAPVPVGYEAGCIGKGKVVPVLKYYAMKTYLGGGGVVPGVLNRGTR
jgi:hypothetical protein